MPQILQKREGETSTASYATLLKCRIIGRPKSSMTIHNAGANSIKWKVLVSNDPQGTTGSWGTEKAEDTLTAGSSEPYVISGCFGWIDIQIVDATAPNHGTCSAYLYATGI